MRRAEVVLVVVIRREDLSTPGVRSVQGETRLTYRAAVLPILTIGMEIVGGLARGRPWDGFRVDSVRAEEDTGRVVASMIIAAQTPLAEASLVREWKAKGWQ